MEHADTCAYGWIGAGGRRQDDEIALADRIACAARFLSDDDLALALDTLTQAMVAKVHMQKHASCKD